METTPNDLLKQVKQRRKRMSRYVLEFSTKLDKAIANNLIFTNTLRKHGK